MKNKAIIFIHWTAVILSWTAFLWLDWKIVFVGVLIYWLQIIIVGSCVLSVMQFKNKETTFVGFNANKFLKKFNKQLTLRQQQVYLRWINPTIILIFAILLQVLLNWKPIIHFSI